MPPNNMRDTASVALLSYGKQNSFLHRARLHQIMAEAVEKPVVAIIAGAGYGKSMAVSLFLADKRSRTAWLSLTQMDNLVTRLWERFVRSMRYTREDSAEKLMRIGFPESDIALDNFTRILSDEIVDHEKYFIVLDDFYMITNPVILRFWERLIYARIEGLCVIVISRYELPIQALALLSKNLLSRIDEDALRLTKEETFDFFKMRKIMLSSQAVSDFHAYTDGWFFATQLVCLSLKQNVFYSKNPMAAVKLDVYGLLESEVFAELSEALQNLLIRLSLLESLPTELLMLLTGEDRLLVRQVLRIKSFFLYDHSSQTYRIHQLFLNFLREKQEVLPESEKIQIYRIAAKWYAQNGYGIDAITHYEKIGDYEEIAHILLTYTRRLPADTIDFLLGVIDRMPEKSLRERPILHVLYAKFLLNNFKAAEANRLLEEIRNTFEAMPLTEETKAVLGEVYVMLGFQSFMTGPFTRVYESAHYFRKADEYLPSGSKLNDDVHYYCGNYACNVLCSEQGEVEKSIEASRQMEPYSARVLAGMGMGTEYLMRAEYACFQKDMRRAEKYANQAIAKARESNQFDTENHALFLLTRIGLASGSYAKIMDTLEKQNQLVRRVNYTEAYAVHEITTGWFYAQIGQTAKVAEWIKDEAKSREVMSPITFATDKLVRAACLLADNKVYELLALVDRREEGLSFESFLFGLIEMKVLKAIALGMNQEYKESAEVFQEAYALAAPNDLVLPFIQNGTYMRTLIGKISAYCAIPQSWFDNIRIKSSTYAKRLGSIAAEHRASTMTKMSRPSLSRREMEMLACLCQGLTREEAADHCGISVNTIKSITQSVYFKLGVSNSIDAVRVATLLRLME